LDNIVPGKKHRRDKKDFFENWIHVDLSAVENMYFMQSQPTKSNKAGKPVTYGI